MPQDHPTQASVIVACLVTLAGCGVELGANGSSGGPPSGSSGGSSGGPASIARECEEGGPSTQADGWTRAVKPTHLEMTGGELRVEVHHPLQLDDVPRTIENVWKTLVGDRYQLQGSLTIDEAGAGLTAFAEGSTIETATGEPAFVKVTADWESGRAYPVMVVAPTESALRATLADTNAVQSLRGYNFMPLECQGLGGDWTSTFTSAAETYSPTGAYTGLAVAAATVEIQIRGDSYTRQTRVFLNGQSSNTSDEGSLRGSGNSLVTTASDGRETAYHAGLVAVKGGFALYLVNKEFEGDRTLLYRK